MGSGVGMFGHIFSLFRKSTPRLDRLHLFSFSFSSFFSSASALFSAFLRMFSSLVFGFLVLHLIAASQGRFKTLAHEGTALIGAKAGEFDILLSGLNLEGKIIDFVPYNLYETIRGPIY